MKWRLGLDMGTNSLGWSVLELDENNNITTLKDMGVRIFPDGREPSQNGRVGVSLAVARRIARGVRRNRDRRLKRNKHLLIKLKEFGLEPDENLNPYECRANATTEKVTAKELGRALLHLCLRRGFKSNRKTDNDEEKSEFKKKISSFREEIGENRTLGQFLYERLKNRYSVRFKGTDGDWYPDRQMYLDEFKKIKDIQGNTLLTEERWDKIEDIIFYQRPLKAVERGKCRFYKTQERAHLGLPIAHSYRIICEVNNLQYINEETLERSRLDEEQRHIIFNKLHEQKSMTWGAMRKLKRENGESLFPQNTTFNFERASNKRAKLEGNIAKIDLENLLGNDWISLNDKTQNDIVDYLYEANEDKEIIAKSAEWGISEEMAKKLASYTPKSGTASVSRKFMEDIIPIMLKTGKRFDEAIQDLHDEDGVVLHHSASDDEKTLERLPYYGEILPDSVMGKGLSTNKSDPDVFKYGKINNPTVHVALNQLRKLINSLIDEYGCKPEQIHVELSRDLKNSGKAREEISKAIAANEKENKRRANICKEQGIAEPTALDLKKIKLWEELGKLGDRKCVYTGRTISAAQLFNGEVEIEHILPFGSTLDDSMANKTVSFRDANRIKGKDTPYGAKYRFAKQGWKWEDILERASKLPDSKRWRFNEDALEKFNKTNDFIKRQLTDNAYIARKTQEYLWRLSGKNNIVPVSGQMTAMLRGKWGLNSLLGEHDYKERNDHRHHAIDALVVALTERSTLQKINTIRGTDDRNHLTIPDFPLDMNDISKKLNDIVVSFRADHGISGRFFADTAYGKIKEDKRDEKLKEYGLVTTKPIEILSKAEVEKGQIRDKTIHNALQNYLEENSVDIGDKNALKKALYDFGHRYWSSLTTKKGTQRPPIKKVRVLISNQSAIKIPSAPYKSYAPDGYVCCDIYQIPKGKKGKWKKGEYEWKGEFRSYIDMQERNRPKDMNSWKPHPAAKHIMRVYKDDMVIIEENGETKIMRVAGFSTTNNKLDLRLHTDSNSKQKYISINKLKNSNLKKINVSPNGRIIKYGSK